MKKTPWFFGKRILKNRIEKYLRPKIEEIWDMIKTVDGLKTHIVAWLLFALVVLEQWLGVDIPGFTPPMEPVDAFLAAAGISSVRDMFRKWMT